MTINANHIGDNTMTMTLIPDEHHNYLVRLNPQRLHHLLNVMNVIVFHNAYLDRKKPRIKLQSYSAPLSPAEDSIFECNPRRPKGHLEFCNFNMDQRDEQKMKNNGCNTRPDQCT